MGLTDAEARAVAYQRLLASRRSFVLVGANGPWKVESILEAY